MVVQLATPTPATPDPLKGHPRYQTVVPLSSGSFGFVHLCKDLQTDEHVAIKFLARGERVSKYVQTEVLNHRLLRHPHVVEFKEVFLLPEHICIVMEYANGGSLFDYVRRSGPPAGPPGRLLEPAARWFFQQLIIGLDYCHRRGVVSRDIKLENTLLTMLPGIPLPLLKICDFGYSKVPFLSAPKSKVGTLAYMAPEVIRCAAPQQRYSGEAADLWSAGVMLYVMLFGAYPFESPAGKTLGEQARKESMMQRIIRVDWSMPSGVQISPSCRDLLSRLLVGDPAQRLSMAAIMTHPWFAENLPPHALSMNDGFLVNADYTGVQSEEDVRRVLAEAATTTVPLVHHHRPPPEEEEECGSYYDVDIDGAIEEELGGDRQPSHQHARLRHAGPPGQPGQQPAVVVLQPPHAAGGEGTGAGAGAGGGGGGGASGAGAEPQPGQQQQLHHPPPQAHHPPAHHHHPAQHQHHQHPERHHHHQPQQELLQHHHQQPHHVQQHPPPPHPHGHAPQAPGGQHPHHHQHQHPTHPAVLQAQDRGRALEEEDDDEDLDKLEPLDED